MSEIQRYLTNRTGKERLGVLNENKILSIEYFADSIGLDIVEELEQIRQGKKKKEETGIIHGCSVTDDAGFSLSYE